MLWNSAGSSARSRDAGVEGCGRQSTHTRAHAHVSGRAARARNLSQTHAVGDFRGRLSAHARKPSAQLESRERDGVGRRRDHAAQRTRVEGDRRVQLHRVLGHRRRGRGSERHHDTVARAASCERHLHRRLQSRGRREARARNPHTEPAARHLGPVRPRAAIMAASPGDAAKRAESSVGAAGTPGSAEKQSRTNRLLTMLRADRPSVVSPAKRGHHRRKSVSEEALEELERCAPLGAGKERERERGEGCGWMMPCALDASSARLRSRPWSQQKHAAPRSGPRSGRAVQRIFLHHGV